MKSIKTLIELKEEIKPNEEYRDKHIHIGNFDLTKEKTS